jgi:hypothetical protein
MAASLVRRGTSLEVTEIRALFDLRASRQGRYPYDVSADGQRFLVNRPDDSAPKPVPINVVLNWTGAMKR